MGGGLFGRQTQNTSGTSNQTATTNASGTSQVQIPAWLENAARQNMARADAIAQIGYVPYSGPDVAALTPMQIAAMQNTGNAASAFGLASSDPTAGLPQAQDFGGVQGYSSFPVFEQVLADLRANRPGQYNALVAPFINPVTGAAPAAPFGSMGSAPESNSQPDPRQNSVNEPPPMMINKPMLFGRDLSAFPYLVNSVPSQPYERLDWYGRPRALDAGDGMTSGRSMPQSSGGSLGGLLSNVSASLPGGVNSPFGGGLIDRVAASLSRPQGAPTSASRPAANPRR